MSAAAASTRRVVVVGAGVMGLSAAIELARIPGVEVTVLESGYPGGGSTSRSVGVYTRQYNDRLDLEIRKLSIDRLYELERQGRITLRRVGFARLGRSESDREVFAESVRMQEAVGIEDPGRVIEVDELAALVPDFDLTGVTSGLWCPTEGYLDGAVISTALAEEAADLGVELVVRARLREARRDGSGWTLQTTASEHRADLVINCAGAWSAEVGAILEAPVEMVNERHEAFILELPDRVEYEVPMVMDWVPGGEPTEGLYFRQEGESQIVAGMHSTDILGEAAADPDDYFEGATEAGTEQIVKTLDAAFPGLDDLRLRDGWAGIYPHSATGGPLAGPHPDQPTVLVGTGLGGVGLSLGPALGRVLAEWVEHGEVRSVAGAEALLPPAA